MRTPQLLWSTVIAGAVAMAPACNRADTKEDAKRAAAEVKQVAAQAAAKAGDQLADSWLTTKIQAQFFADDDIKARYINVSTRDGVVTLSGRVESPNAKEQALQIARNTDGVREVHDRLGIGSFEQARDGSLAPEQMDSAWITTKIQAKYFADPSVNGRDIDVTTTNGVVTLSGRVDSEQEKRQAIAIARGTDGVARIDDRLVVRPDGAIATTGTAPVDTALATKIDDTRITSTIQSKYFLDELVKGRRINVDTRQGVVTLRGEVSNESERAQALLLARNTDGVQRVEDNLTVNAATTASSTPAVSGNTPSIGERIDDALLTTKIQSKFFLDDQVKAGSIDVTSKDGIVLLEGTVPSEAARKKTLSIAGATDGVVQVVDRLKVVRKK